MEENTNKSALASVGSKGQVNNPKKRNISIKEVENGWVIYLDLSGFAYGEKTYIAKTIDEVLNIMGSIDRNKI